MMMVIAPLLPSHIVLFFFFFNDTATTEIYTLSLHDALPISFLMIVVGIPLGILAARFLDRWRSEEHTSELQSPYVISYAVFCLEHKSELQSPYVISYAVFCLQNTAGLDAR